LVTTPLPDAPSRLPWSAVWVLSVTQIISWGSTFYLIAVLIAPLERELGWSRDAIVGAFSVSMVLSGMMAVPAGMLIDRHGGRAVMGCGSLAAAATLAAMSQTSSLAVFYALWIALGIVMATILYEPAFTVIAASFGTHARRGITTLTLAGGFASTVFWPLTQFLIASLGWRHALLVLALFNFAICAPLHLWLLPRRAARLPSPRDASAAPPQRLRDIVLTRMFLLLALAFAGNMLAFSALSVHLIPLLNERGFTMADAVWLAALVGPMQVAGRVGEMTVGRRWRATQIALIALALLPLALVILSGAGARVALVIAFITCYGASNGIMTIARGSIPVELYGHERYGAVNGALAAPVLAARSLGPFIASLVWSAAGGYDAVVWTLFAIGIGALASFGAALRK